MSDIQGSTVIEIKSPFADKAPELFDTKGAFVRPPDSVLDALPDYKRERLLIVADAAAEAKQAEIALKDANAYVVQCADTLTEARARLDKLRPRKSFMDIWREQKLSEAIDRGLITPKPEVPANKEAELQAIAHVAKREDLLVEARAFVVRENSVVRQKRAALVKAISNFQAAFPVISQEQLHRNHAKSEHRRRLDIATGRLAPPRQVSSVGPSQLDHLRKAGAPVGRRPVHDIGDGMGPRVIPTFRAGHQGVKLPSER